MQETQWTDRKTGDILKRIFFPDGSALDVQLSSISTDNASSSLDLDSNTKLSQVRLRIWTD